ncbi:tetratricopeptide repeat protein [Leptospira santarosai]|nr:tetratricopeptide repeat protein [Leptospira santarosai]MDO6395929.1 tetratricopeptide repeat protein [Leptospira santarosai]
MKRFYFIGNILRFVLGSISILLFMFSFEIFSEDRTFSGGHEDAKKLLEEKRYLEAEKLAFSLLTNNPSDVNAEYILTSAWVGLGREEVKKGNYARAIDLLNKAALKWPFDQDLKKEIELLGNISSKKYVQSNASLNRKSSNSQAVILLDSDLFRSIDDLKSELHSILSVLRDFDSFHRESDSFSKREFLFLGIISVLTLVSFLNLFLSFLLWKR